MTASSIQPTAPFAAASPTTDQLAATIATITQAEAEMLLRNVRASDHQRQVAAATTEVARLQDELRAVDTSITHRKAVMDGVVDTAKEGVRSAKDKVTRLLAREAEVASALTNLTSFGGGGERDVRPT